MILISLSSQKEHFENCHGSCGEALRQKHNIQVIVGQRSGEVSNYQLTEANAMSNNYY